MNLKSSDYLSNIRVRVLLLVIFTLVPFAIVTFLINRNELNQAKKTQIIELEKLAHLVALENKQITEGARQLLIALSATSKINIPSPDCSSYLSAILGNYQRYGNFGVADGNGQVICSGIKLKDSQNLSDRYFFTHTKETQNFTVGEYVISRSTNLASLNFGYPLTNGGVVYATLNLDWLGKFISGLNLDNDLTTLILDRSGVVLARNTDSESWIGQKFIPNDQNVLAEPKGILESPGVDGIKRIYAYEQSGDGEDRLYILAGKKESDIFKIPISNFKKTLFLLFAASGVSLIIGMKFGNYLISKSVEKTKELEDLKRDFISLASHQIRTPVTAIKWFSEILLSKSPGILNRRQEKIIKDTHLSAKRMIELISTILSISKLESKRIKLDPNSVNLSTLINTSAADIKRIYKSKKIELKTKIPKSLPKKVFIDQKLMSQVIQNLLDNAFKYNHAGGNVLLEAKRLKSQIFITITDSGIGIPKKESQTLFQKFSRASNARLKDTEGAGLGLYLAKLIVEAHGGKIDLVPTKLGTKIYFTIPHRNDNI